MKLIRGLYNIREYHQKAVVTIGNFDGFHRGHQAILRRVVESAKTRGVPSMLISFEPQPLEFFSLVIANKVAQSSVIAASEPGSRLLKLDIPCDASSHNRASLDPGSGAAMTVPRHDGKVPARLTRLREKCFFLEKFGIDYFLCLPFNQSLADMPAPDFVQKVFLDLNVSEVIVGDDFKFGKGRAGDVDLLRNLGLNVHQFESQLINEERVSSTLVRAALQAGHLKLAEQLLGRPYSMMGRVVHGAKLGRQWGIPTANIFLHRQVSPISGIFAVKMHGLDRVYNGVANIGSRPTVDGAGRVLLEVHLFDFDADIYGAMVEVEFCAKRRDEERYDSVDVLIAEIKKDIAWARQCFAQG